MKQMMRYAILPVILALASCMENDVYDPGKDKEDKPALDLSFKFAMKSSKTISVSAFDAGGNPGKGVLFNIYQENPFTEEGLSHSAEPLYAGYTDEQGRMRAAIAVPENIRHIYVYPATAGFGTMQKVEVTDMTSLVFRGVPFPRVAETRAASLDISALTPSLVGKRYNIHCLYKADDVTDKHILIPGKSPLVTREDLSTDFLNLVNSWYPERKFQNEELLQQSSDIVITDVQGAEIWVTYIGDGGFNQGRGVLMYYNYTAGELTSNQNVYTGESPAPGALADLLHMTLLFPNTDSGENPAGTRVQLLYWNKQEQKYETVFPQGTRVGFSFGRAANKLEKAVNSADNYWFAQPWHSPLSSSNTYYPLYEMFYSTPPLSGAKPDGSKAKTNAIIRACPAYDCLVVGMDARYWSDPSTKNDRDYNDVLFKVVANPPKGIVPENNMDVDPAVPFDAQHGTLAFEDLWPRKGDYDFNDLVVDYTYRRLKTKGGIVEVQLEFHPKARGGSVTSGFGIELPFPATMVKTVTGATLEAGNEKATLIVWNNTDDVFGGRGIINTYKGSNKVDTEPSEVTVTLVNPLGDSEVDRLAFNPFLYVEGNRGHEIHLVDFPPTPKADKSFFGLHDDRSDPSQGIYYRMDNTYPWALDIPRASSSVPSWRYPVETSDIAGVYLNYESWVQNKTEHTDWFDSSVSGNVNEDKLY